MGQQKFITSRTGNSTAVCVCMLILWYQEPFRKIFHNIENFDTSVSALMRSIHWFINGVSIIIWDKNSFRMASQLLKAWLPVCRRSLAACMYVCFLYWTHFFFRTMWYGCIILPRRWRMRKIIKYRTYRHSHSLVNVNKIHTYLSTSKPKWARYIANVFSQSLNTSLKYTRI